jgi:hypothetical protein
MRIQCMYCGHSIELSPAYEEYKGPLRCVVCKNLMMVRIEDGQLRSMEVEPKAAAPAVALKSRSANPAA